MQFVAIVILILVIALIIKVIKLIPAILRNLFFNPRVNSVVTVLFLALFIISTSMNFSDFPLAIKILWGIAIIDCLRDIIRADQYYVSLSVGKDSFYVKKSLLSFFTFGLARVVYLVIVTPVFHISAASFITGNKVFLSDDLHRGSKYYNFILNGKIFSGVNSGRIFTYREEKYSYSGSSVGYVNRKFFEYSKKRVAKAIENNGILCADSVSSLNELKDLFVFPQVSLNGSHAKIYTLVVLEDVEKSNQILSFSMAYDELVESDSSDNSRRSDVYVDIQFYDQFKKKLAQSMEKNGILTPGEAYLQDELKDLFTRPKAPLDDYVAEYFTVFVLEELEQKGLILSNKDIIDSEESMSQQKIDKSKPVKFVPKVLERITKDGRAARAQRSNDQLELYGYSDSFVYINKIFLEECKKRIAQTMETRSRMTPKDISEINELKDLFNRPKINLNAKRTKLFTTFILEELVQDGTMDKVDLHLQDRLENYQYQHVNSGTKVSRDGNSLLGMDL